VGNRLGVEIATWRTNKDIQGCAAGVHLRGGPATGAILA